MDKTRERLSLWHRQQAVANLKIAATEEGEDRTMFEEIAGHHIETVKALRTPLPYTGEWCFDNKLMERNVMYAVVDKSGHRGIGMLKYSKTHKGAEFATERWMGQVYGKRYLNAVQDFYSTYNRSDVIAFCELPVWPEMDDKPAEDISDVTGTSDPLTNALVTTLF